MKKDLSSPYENMLMHLFLNNHIDFFFTKKNKYDILYINYKGFIQRIIEVETVLLHTPWVKRNVGKGTPANNSSLPYIRKSDAIEV